MIHSDPSILGGTPVFRGTRVPLKNLVDYLAAGDSLASGHEVRTVAAAGWSGVENGELLRLAAEHSAELLELLKVLPPRQLVRIGV
jgi:hypothetical protein